MFAVARAAAAGRHIIASARQVGPGVLREPRAPAVVREANVQRAGLASTPETQTPQDITFARPCSTDADNPLAIPRLRRLF
jgi:hypothetical protein